MSKRQMHRPTSGMTRFAYFALMTSAREVADVTGSEDELATLKDEPGKKRVSSIVLKMNILTVLPRERQRIGQWGLSTQRNRSAGR